MKRVMLWCVVILLSLSVHAATQPQTGDYLDFTLKDGRVFKNAEVIRADQYSVFIKTGNSLTSFKLHEIRTFSPPEVITVIATETKQLQESPKQENTGAVVPTTTEEPSQASPAKNRPAVETRPLTSAQQEPEAPLNRPVQPVVSSAKVVLIGSLLALLGFGLWQMQAAKRSATANKGLKETVALYESRYSGLIDLDKAVDERNKQVKELSVSLVQRQGDIEKLNADLVALKKTLSLFDSEQDMVACGHYKPAYHFGTSEEYKAAIDENREKQREMIKAESAAVCPQEWLVNGNKAEGKKATKRTLRLMLRAFNGECDAVIANVSWSNIDRMMDRLNNTFDAINKLGESYECSLAVPYRWLKEKELRLAFEYATKRQKEKDEQRDLREQMREEEIGRAHV